MLVDRKKNTNCENKSRKRLFDVYAETKSVKSYTKEDVQFMFPEIVKSTITIEFQKEGHIFASTHGDHTVKIVDFGTGKILRTLIGHPRTPWSVKFHPRNPDILVSGCIGSTVIVWNWRKNETLAYTQIMSNVMISSLDWHPTEEVILITCGTTVYIWDYIRNALVNLFPTSVRKYQFAFFYGDGKDFIASHENVVNRRDFKTYTISRYNLIKDKYAQTTVVYGSFDISTQSTVNSSNGIHISRNGDYAIISICEGPLNIPYNPTFPEVPSASILQLHRNPPYVLPIMPIIMPSPSESQTPTTAPSQQSGINLYQNDPIDSDSRVIPPYGSLQVPNIVISQRRDQEDTEVDRQRDVHNDVRIEMMTPPRMQNDRIFPMMTPPLERQVPPNVDEEFLQLPRPRHLLMQTAGESLLRPMAVPTFQQIETAPMQRPIQYPRYIAKVCLVGKNMGKVVSKYKIPDHAMVASLQISPSNDFILASYRIRNAEKSNSFTSIFFHIYRQFDWKLYYEAIGENDNANIATWSPMMDGIVVGTEKGKLIIYRGDVSPLARSRLSSIKQEKDDESEDNLE